MYPLVESDHVQDQAAYQEQSSPVFSNLIPDEFINDLLYRNSKEAIVQLISLELDEVNNLPVVDRISFFSRLGFASQAIGDLQDASDSYTKAIEIAESAGEVWGMLEGYVDASDVSIRLGDLQSAQDLLDKAEILLKSFNKVRFRAYLKCQLGYLHIEYHNYSRAQEYFLEAQRLFDAIDSKSLKDIYYQTKTYGGLGLIHERNGSYGLSIKAYIRAYKQAKEHRLMILFPKTALSLSKVYIKNDNHIDAETVLDEVIQFEDQMQPVHRAGILSNLGYCRMQNGAHKTALSLLEESKKIYLNSSKDCKEDLFSVERWTAILHQKTENYEQAGAYFQNAFKLAEDIKGFRALSTIYRDIADYYSKTQNFKAAYNYSMLHNEAIENYYEELSDQQRYEVEIKYETELKEKETEHLHLQAAKLQLKALRAQMNPHFIYNALNAIQHFISAKREKDAATYLAKFAVLMRKSLDYSDKEYISLEEEIAFINDYLEINQKLRFEDAMRYIVVVEEDLEEDILGIPSMIIQPYVENAIEHGIRMKKDGIIKIEFQTYDEDHILCVIEDNGIGRVAAAEYKAQKEDLSSYESKGTKITEQRLQLINKTSQRNLYVRTIDLVDDNASPCGTKVEIRIPVSELP